jgi:sporulation protein YlmC with PRC-barrel domain
MLRSKPPKDEEFSEENMIGKTIVDPEGTIIGTCVGIFEDEKKRQRMKVAIKTEIASDFVVGETIPINLINRIGEVILLKKKFEIEPIALEDIISIEIPGSKVEEMLEKPEEEKPVDEIVPIEPKKKVSKTNNLPKQIEEQKEKKKSKAITFDEIYSDVKQTQDKDARKILINSLLQTIKKSSSQRKKVLTEIFENLVTSDVQKRYLIVEILEHIALNCPNYLLQEIVQGLEAIYNEPNKDIEKRFIEIYNKLVSEKNEDLPFTGLKNFFESVLIKQEVCTKITKNHIHNLNVKIFINNFEVQEILVNLYLQEMLKNTTDTTEFAELLQDYNAIIIAYTLIQEFDLKSRATILKKKSLKSSYNVAFIETIEKIVNLYNEGNIKELSEIFDPKLGITFSHKIISNIVKDKIHDVLANVSILPLNIFSAYFQDDENRTVQIIYELINKREISAQIIFIEDKTYIAPMDV